MPADLIQPSRECIHILLIGGTQNSANQYAATLREQGQAAAIDHISNAKQRHTQRQPTTAYAFFLIHADASKDIQQTAATLRKQTPGACILLLSETPQKHLGYILETGIRDIVHPANSRHLGFVILREQQFLQQQQALASARQQLEKPAQKQLAAPPAAPQAVQPMPPDKPSAIEAHMGQVLQQALKQNRCQLCYQLMLSPTAQQHRHYQLAWQLPDAPDIANAIHSSTGPGAQALAIKIDHWAIRQTVQSLFEQHQQGNQAHFHLTLSHAAIQQPEGTLAAMRQTLQQAQKLGAYLTLQFAEQTLRSELENAHTLIPGLQKIGCRVAVSQFENSQGSNTMLEYLHIDSVNFAPAWAQHVHQDEIKQSQLNALNQQLHKQHSMQTIISGVQNAASMALLWDMGFNYLLGDFIQPVQDKVAL